MTTWAEREWLWHEGTWEPAGEAGGPFAVERRAADPAAAAVIGIEIRVDDERSRHRDDADQRSRVVPQQGRIVYLLALTALLDDGRRLTVESWGVHARPPVRLSEIREHLEIGLGRRSEPRPVPSAWVPLVDALAEDGVTVKESDMKVLPLRLLVAPSAVNAVTFD